MINRKFIATMGICICALMGVATASYYMKDSENEGKIKLQSISQGETTESAVPETEEQALNADSQIVENETEESAGDRISSVDEEGSSYTGNIVDVSETEEESVAVVEESPIKNEDSNGLSAAANATIASLTFGNDTDMLWPVQGNVLLEYNVDNTVYFSTLNEYKTNPALVIQGTEYAPIVAAAKGVVTEIGDDEKIGVYIKMALGNDYEVTYGQVVNPVVDVGQTVEEGQTIACVNEPTRYFEKEGYNLYFKMTKDGEPVDPMNHLVLSE